MPSSFNPEAYQPLESWIAAEYTRLRRLNPRPDSSYPWGEPIPNPGPREMIYVPVEVPPVAIPDGAITLRQCAECSEFFPLDHYNTTRNTRQCYACRQREREALRTLQERGRRFGVELEFTAQHEVPDRYSSWPNSTYTDVIPSSVIAENLRAAGLRVRDEGYTHRVVEGEWKIVSDSSVDCGWELVSPPLYWDQRDQIVTACRVLSDLGCEATDDCGLHVHHEVRDFNMDELRTLVRDWSARQPVTDRLVEPHRHSNRCQWAAAFSHRDLRNLDHIQGRDDFESYIGRYHSLNTTCLSRYGTVEVRQHHSTLDAATIIGWIAYGQAFMDASKNGTLAPIPEVPSTPECVGMIDTMPIKCEASKAALKSLVEEANVERTIVPNTDW